MKKHRVLSERTKREIREAFRVYTKQELTEEVLVRLCADHTIGLLQMPEDTTNEWYEDGKTKTNPT